MSKIVEDGQRRYQAANTENLAEQLQQRTTRIESHYGNRMANASLLRRLRLKLMKRQHLSRVKREIEGSGNFYLTAPS